MAEKIIIPSKEAVKKYNLDRFVATQTPNNNPFIKVSKNPSTSGITTEDYFQNEVIVEAYVTQPIKITTETVDGMSVIKADGGGVAPTPTQVFQILLDTDDVAVKYGKHTWEEPPAGFWSNINNAIGDAGQAVTNVITDVANGASRAFGGDYIATPTLSKPDYQKVYKNSEFPTITLSFTMLTCDNFIDDILDPFLKLTALTYPERLSPGSASGVAQTTAAVANAVREAQTLTARQFAFNPPHMFNIYHQSGLYSYSYCMCTELNVTYSGPWYNASASEQEVFDVIQKGSGIKLDISKRLFPTIAKVTMSFETGVRLASQDLLMMASQYKSVMGKSSTSFSQFKK